MNLEGRRAGWEGRRDGLFVLVGYEHEDDRQLNHYIAFGTDKIAKGLTEPQEYIDRINQLGGVGFLAHPAENRSAIKSLPPYSWTKWDVTGFDGIEIWNQFSDWMEHVGSLKNLPRLLLRLHFPNHFLRSAPKELLDRWDRMNRARFVGGIGGVDAHTHKITRGPFSCVLFPIEEELRGVRTHLFVDAAKWADGKKAGRVLIDAMRDGRGFISNFAQGDARGCKIFLSGSGGEIEYPGRPQNNPALPATINVELTQKAKIKLLRNGKVIHSASSNKAAWPITEPGAYRIEAHRGRNTWIYSNPFPVGQYPL
jgi:hypothetical protein